MYSDKKVAVIIPCYRVQEKIGEVLHSIPEIILLL